MPLLLADTDIVAPPPPVEGVCPLGMEPVDLFVNGVLQTAGITVELVEVRGESPVYLAAQIVDAADIRTDLSTFLEYANVKWNDKENFLGLQVKLGGAHKWKVTIAQKMLVQHVSESGRPNRSSRDRTPAAEKHVIVNHNNWEVVVPVQVGEGKLMKATVATALGITINIAFKTTEKNDGVLEAQWNDSNEMPLIEQRRIDVMFANKYACDVQVRRSGTLELWNSSALERNGILTERWLEPASTDRLVRPRRHVHRHAQRCALRQDLAGTHRYTIRRAADHVGEYIRDGVAEGDFGGGRHLNVDHEQR